MHSAWILLSKTANLQTIPKIILIVNSQKRQMISTRTGYEDNECTLIMIYSQLKMHSAWIFPSLRVDLLFQKKKGSTKQRAKTCYKVSRFLET